MRKVIQDAVRTFLQTKGYSISYGAFTRKLSAEDFATTKPALVRVNRLQGTVDNMDKAITDRRLSVTSMVFGLLSAYETDVSAVDALIDELIDYLVTNTDYHIDSVTLEYGYEAESDVAFVVYDFSFEVYE